MQTIHQYLDKYPINPKSKKLILGTIHPHNHEAFMVPFFYGNQNSLWNILNEAFDGELGSPIKLEGITRFLDSRKIAVSDTIRECSRIHPNALDKDLIPERLNHELTEQIRNSEIEEILFTSGFGKNNAFKLFYQDILKERITPSIKKDRRITTDQTKIGRKIKMTILYSPSGMANVAIAQSRIYQESKHKYEKSLRPVQDFKIDYYRSFFS